jgi:hypothetical protein
MDKRSLVIACGALAREIRQLIQINQWTHVHLECLPASLHNTPNKIPARLAAKLDAVRGHYDRILIAYADCGTAGEIDKLIAKESNVIRLDGPHCFSVLAGEQQHDAIMADTPGTFWLTDFLVRHFKTMVIQSLGLDKHPELKRLYFEHYQQAVYISQTDDEKLLASAQEAANFLGLKLRHIHTGYGQMTQKLKWCAA